MRKYSSTIPAMTLGAQLTAGATSITLSSGSWPTITSPDTLTLVIRPGTEFEEIVYVTAHTSGSTTATILRGQESTADITHPSLAVVKHMITGLDLQEAHNHMNASSYATNNSVAVHGIGSGEGTIVGTDKTQTLKNKTINISDNNQIGGLTVSNVSGIAGTYAPLASPNFTGTPTISGTAIATTASAPASHTHGSVTNDGKIGTTGNLVVTTGTNGTLTALAAGSAGQFLAYNGAWATPTVSGGVSSITGTANQISASASTGAVTLSLPSTVNLTNISLSGNITANSLTISPTELSFLDGVTSNIQTQLNAISAPLWYRRTSDVTGIGSIATNMFATSPSLDANSWYYFKIYSLVTASGASPTTHQVTLSFSSTPQSISANSSLNGTNHNFAAHINSTSATSVTATVSYSGDGLLEIEGFFQTNSTTGGTFAPKLSAASGSLTVKTGSHIQVQKLSSSSASINGTWT